MKKNAASLIDLHLRAMSVMDHHTMAPISCRRPRQRLQEMLANVRSALRRPPVEVVILVVSRGGIVFYPLIQEFRRLGFLCGPSSRRSAANLQDLELGDDILQ